MLFITAMVAGCETTNFDNVALTGKAAECEHIWKLRRWAVESRNWVDVDNHGKRYQACIEGRPLEEQKNQQYSTQPNLNSPTAPVPASNPQREVDLNSARNKCTNLGFKEKTEAYGKCVLELSR
jgi:hypothetical protein